jgi:chorismate dehydratase
MTLKIGLIDYLNTMPFHYDLAERLEHTEVHFERGVPAQMNRMLMSGEIDLAPISAIEAARHADELVILPGLGISSLGAVRTVLLFSWAADMRELDGQPIALTDHSATSVALLKVLCRERYQIQPSFTVTRQHLPSMLAAQQAALVIGDDALVEISVPRSLPHPTTGSPTIPFVYDLSDEWLKMTGLPFTFAVWAARKDRLEALRQANVMQALYDSTEVGLSEAARDTLAQGYAGRLGLPAGVCRRYLRDLRYRLTEEDRAGLKLFLELALEGFDWTQLTFWDEPVYAI